MLESTDLITCVECRKPLRTENGILAGEKLGHDNTIGMCRSCVDMAHYLMHRDEQQYRLRGIDEWQFYEVIRDESAKGLGCAIFDIDGTICDEKVFNLVDEASKRRVHYYPAMAKATMLLMTKGVKIVYLSARMEKYRGLTVSRLHDEQFATGDIILYDGDENDTNFIETTNKWKIDHVRLIQKEHSKLLIMDDNRKFLDTLEMFIYPHDIFNIVDLGRCSIVIIR